MYVLYLDESGTHGEASHFVLGGLAVFEREIHWFSQDLDHLQAEYFPGNKAFIHFHATKLRGPDVDPPWNELTMEQRRMLRERVYEIIQNRRGTLFACAVENAYARDGSDVYELAFEQVISRFDMFIGRTNRDAVADGQGEQRGLLVLAGSSFSKALGVLARKLQTSGTRWGTALHNVTDVPFFASPTETRLLQFADFCSNAVYGRYHSGYTFDFDKIAPKFDQADGVVHGLVHLTTDYRCACLACFSRTASRRNQEW